MIAAPVTDLTVRTITPAMPFSSGQMRLIIPRDSSSGGLVSKRYWIHKLAGTLRTPE